MHWLVGSQGSRQSIEGPLKFSQQQVPSVTAVAMVSCAGLPQPLYTGNSSHLPPPCRSMKLTYQESRVFEGIPTYRFTAPKTLFANGTVYPPNEGFCPCRESGIQNVSSCRFGECLVLAPRLQAEATVWYQDFICCQLALLLISGLCTPDDLSATDRELKVSGKDNAILINVPPARVIHSAPKSEGSCPQVKILRLGIGTDS